MFHPQFQHIAQHIKINNRLKVYDSEQALYCADMYSKITDPARPDQQFGSVLNQGKQQEPNHPNKPLQQDVPIRVTNSFDSE